MILNKSGGLLLKTTLTTPPSCQVLLDLSIFRLRLALIWPEFFIDHTGLNGYWSVNKYRRFDSTTRTIKGSYAV